LSALRPIAEGDHNKNGLGPLMASNPIRRELKIQFHKGCSCYAFGRVDVGGSYSPENVEAKSSQEKWHTGPPWETL